MQYVELKNKLAVHNGYADYGDRLRQKYEDPEFESDVDNLYTEMRPLYLHLHAYVRRKLFDTYGGEIIDLKGTLPQSLLGDMWGRFWVNLYSIGEPFPGEPSMDVTKALVDQGYTINRMFETSDAFYTSMGLKPLPPTFYNLSMLDKPSDGREVICHATAWDFYDGTDFREGANDGFHEAIGELMSMVVSTPKHLFAIGLLDQLPTDNKTEINYLFKQALSTVSTLPFHYLQDVWRWRAFRGDYPNFAEWNDEFWKLSASIVGVHAPAARTPEDLDCPSIFHVATDYDMIRYFTRTILQFQFAESLCEAAGHSGPLTNCDFSNSTLAGAKLSNMLEMGRSRPWADALEVLTGTRKMNARAIREYFAPLENWLIETNLANGDSPGWSTKPPGGGGVGSRMSDRRIIYFMTFIPYVFVAFMR
ncbi:Angiotensin-converting enzyme [Folsomia candida]|uniref:Angiotensin-converting enzyme n=1 Tax=Folsomia candida TaxID=158441 RepID=A0A226CVG0_FOLCA|nr:Angiotensin-converting enzyme [Folsomia candida]